MAQIILDSNNNLIQGDFDNATLNNRTKLQTTTTNATTNVYVVPNGSSTSAGISVANNSSLTNASKIVMATNGSTDTQIISGVNGSGTYLPLSFYTNNAQSMIIDTANNVGIGTSSPSVKLDVNAGTTSGTSFDALVLKGGANSTSGSGAKLFLSGGVGTARAAVIQGLATDNANAHAMVFYTNQASTDPVERMRIDNNGNVLVGTTAATPTAANPGVKIVSPTTAASVWAYNGTSTVPMINFVNGNGTVGHIDTSGSNTSYVTSSDYRLKENIVPMTGALDKVAQLKPVTYTWKSDGSNGQGFIAHELQAVVPECVTGQKDAVNEDGSIDPQGIDTSFLVATLTAAIQEQQAIINELKTRIEALESK